MDFVQAVGKGKNRVWIRIVLRDSKNGVQVMTAHPVIKK